MDGNQNSRSGYLFILRLKRSKESIPDDKSSSVVLVDTVPIAAMMHTVVARRVKDVLKRTELVDDLSVNPELIKRVKLAV